MDLFITRRGGGSGGGLNFTVVGGTIRPANPAENTIWVNTEQEITGWTVSSKDPKSAVTGELYKDVNTTAGYYIKADGSRGSSASWLVSDRIALPPNTKKVSVRTGRTSASGVYHAFYDASGAFISSVSRGMEINTYSVPDGAAGIELSIRVDDGSMSGTSLVAYYETSESDGAVWIQTDDIGTISFNAMKNNEAAVSPVTCLQHTDGAWAVRPSYLYQDGKWHEIRAFLLNGSDECWAATGGWERKPYRGNDGGSYSIGENGLSVIGDSPSVCIGLDNFNPTIIQRFNTLRGTAEVSNAAADSETVFGIMSSNTMPGSGIESAFAAKNMIVGTNGPMEFTVDISNVDSGYVVFTAYNQNIMFEKIWLE